MQEEEIKNKIKNKSILVIGGLGFIGSNIAVKLATYDANVTILDSQSSEYGGNLTNIKGYDSDIEIIHADIRDKQSLIKAFKGKDIIYSLASQVNQFVKDPYYDLEINCKGHLNILEACKESAPEAKIIYSGTRMVYGKILSNPVSEDHPTIPITINGANKLAAEHYYLSYFNNSDIKSTCFRITNPYGPRAQMQHNKYSVINWFIRQAIDNQEITIFGDGNQIRDYIYIDDLADCMIQAGIEPNTNGKVYNLGSGEPTKFIDMVKTIIEIADSGKLTMKEWPEDYKQRESGDFYANIEKIKTTLNWTPKQDITSGIKQTIEYYTKNKAHYW